MRKSEQPHGLANATYRSFAFPNSTRHNDLFRILERENHSAIDRVAYISYLSPISVHSETIQLRTEAASEPLLKSIPRESKATIGAEKFEKVHFRAIKSKYRKNLRGGRILIWPCICHGRKTAARPSPAPLLVEGDMRLVQSRGPSSHRNIRELHQPENQGGSGEIGIWPASDVLSPCL